MKKTKFLLCTLSLFVLSLNSCQESESPGFSVLVEAEEIVYEYVNPDNGSGPMWCHGNTCIVRYGDKVFASGMETLEDHPPMLNTRWLMFERSDEGSDEGWELVYRDEKDRTREPSPLALLGNGDVLLSVNPTLTPPGEDGGPAESYILQFNGDSFADGYETLVPDWEDEMIFRQHTYRSFAVDASVNNLVLFQNYRDTAVAWTFRDGDGNWSSKGFLYWPMGETYEKPEPIRICYPVVQLKDRAVHFLGVSDIIEPVSAWKDYKYELTGRKWDYDFRRLFYVWSEDIGSGEFEEWIEISSREATAGHIFPCDLWVAPDGLVHILWEERALDERLREEFFPDSSQSYALNYAILEDGEVVFRSPIMLWEEGEDGSGQNRSCSRKGPVSCYT